MNPYFPECKKKLAFGMMRLPMIGDKVDFDTTSQMVDLFMERGFNYFDTAHPYIQGQSEEAVKKCLSSRYPRESYILTNKLSGSCFSKTEEIVPLFESQLEACGVEYFDFYLMHAMNAKRHAVYKELRAYEIAQELKAQGKVRHIGMSFHDSAEVLDQMLSELPFIEVVQIQFNYVDFEDLNVQSRKCYEVCRKHNKPVLIMEPVKGGSLVNLPKAAAELLTQGSPASYAIRFCASFEGVAMVLSGMSDMAQMDDNTGYMADFKPLTQEEMAVIDQVRTIYQSQHRIPCTACSYCTDGCPAGIPIPDLFACMNDLLQKTEGADPAGRYAAFDVKADACIKCGQCESVCPQNLHIRELLDGVAAAFA